MFFYKFGIVNVNVWVYRLFCAWQPAWYAVSFPFNSLWSLDISLLALQLFIAMTFSLLTCAWFHFSAYCPLIFCPSRPGPHQPHPGHPAALKRTLLTNVCYYFWLSTLQLLFYCVSSPSAVEFGNILPAFLSILVPAMQKMPSEWLIRRCISFMWAAICLTSHYCIFIQYFLHLQPFEGFAKKMAKENVR